VVQRLREAAAYRVAVVLAPAGYGKSIALGQLLEAIGSHWRVDVGMQMPTARFAAELSAALDAGAGTIAVDGLDAQDPEAAVAVLVDRIEQTKTGTHWIVASRSALGLPIGTWLAYRDCELIVGSADLKYSRDEIVDAALRLGFGLGDDELDDIVSITEG